jgi:hypothetical protein
MVSRLFESRRAFGDEKTDEYIVWQANRDAEPLFFGDDHDEDIGESWELFTFAGITSVSCSSKPPYNTFLLDEIIHIILMSGPEQSMRNLYTRIPDVVVVALLSDQCW